MAQPITDQVSFLGQACTALQELAESKGLLEKFRLEEKRLEKELEGEKKAVTDAISLTVKKRIEEINNTYDKEISREQDRLRKVRSKREKAKSQGIKERIEEETAELRDYNKELKLNMKSLFQQERVPSFCKSGWFYSLYLPRGIRELFTLFMAVLICFLGIPWGIYMLLPVKSAVYLIAVYFITILCFGGLYIFINNLTKVRHMAALKKGRAIRDIMKSNDKKIRVIVHSIRRDRDEAVYNLEKFDDEIAKIQQDLTELADKKREALNTFDKVTRTIISDEIAGGSRQRMEELSAEYEEAARSRKEEEAKVKEQTLFVHDNYTMYIGAEFMAPEKLDELADLIRLGRASTISEAESLYLSQRE